MARLAFIGLGVMGYPMAGHLRGAGHEVWVYNRTSKVADRWVSEHRGRSAPTPAEAARDAEVVFACVGNDDSVREVTGGATGAFAGMAEGSVFVDHTTASAELARELAETAGDRGIGWLDAPVSGGQAGAENGRLTVMAGGEEQAFAKAQPFIETYARQLRLMGPAGSGQLTKMVNQICIAGLIQSLAEGLHFAQQAGLDPQAVVDVISKGAAQSWQMDNRHATMLADEYEHGFAVDWMRKDLGIALREAARNGASLPVAALVDQFYAEVQNLGGGRWDTSSLLRRLEGKQGTG
ncbi:MAG: NAD(P)-dependent oxidoreductase [Xanthomonadales bacterium]|nr:NAD(P)-dependent oxidoreductase [Xanthomonadales bacterium]